MWCGRLASSLRLVAMLYSSSTNQAGHLCLTQDRVCSVVSLMTMVRLLVEPWGVLVIPVFKAV
jgi:hypothetical protein